jgi:hypothetical protein
MKKEVCYCTGYGTNVPIQIRCCDKDHWFCNDQTTKELIVKYEDEFRIEYYRFYNYNDWIPGEIFFSIHEKGVNI